jgi:two-component sensor histidine kinase
VRASLREKEVLLKEIHHRVKNNLQIVSSLLSLQSRHASDEPSLEVLRESQNRVRTMALIHEKLYQSNDFTQVDFADYAQSLMTMLSDSFGQRIRRTHVRLRAVPVHLHIDRAIPAGLILNELVSNCFKHAFPDDREGAIVIDVAARGDSRAVLRVSDDGVGPPPGVDFAAGQSLGLQLVHILAAQLNASLVFRRESGLTVELEFERFEVSNKG